MVTNEELQFIQYWEENRGKRKKFLRQLAIGLPLGFLFALAIFINVASGWYKKATMVIKAEPSLILVLIVAIISIVIFISVYSAKHKWDLNEQRYKELMSKREHKN